MDPFLSINDITLPVDSSNGVTPVPRTSGKLQLAHNKTTSRSSLHKVGDTIDVPLAPMAVSAWTAFQAAVPLGARARCRGRLFCADDSNTAPAGTTYCIVTHAGGTHRRKRDLSVYIVGVKLTLTTTD